MTMNVSSVIDKFKSFFKGVDSPSEDFAAVTPADGAPLTYLSRALYIGGTGDVTVIDKNGNSVLFKAVPVGTILPIRVAQVMATGTTATNIVQL